MIASLEGELGLCRILPENNTNVPPFGYTAYKILSFDSAKNSVSPPQLTFQNGLRYNIIV